MPRKSKETLQLKDENKKLEFLLEESIPKEQNERKRYMADIALFYERIFKDKLRHFIGDQLQELALIGRTELSTNIIRSNINCFRLIDEWMKTRTNEHLANLEEMREKFGEGDGFKEHFRKTYL